MDKVLGTEGADGLEVGCSGKVARSVGLNVVNLDIDVEGPIFDLC